LEHGELIAEARLLLELGDDEFAKTILIQGEASVRVRECIDAGAARARAGPAGALARRYLRVSRTAAPQRPKSARGGAPAIIPRQRCAGRSRY
jgi:hypothetical protein